jgi:hypothetical protein
LPAFTINKISPCRFSKALGANGSKGFDLTGFEKLSENSKGFGA